jgi:nicotinamide mononucleotide (NMN) deamidase PncC
MEIEELAKRVAIALMDKNYKIATAEECTAGLIGAAIASQDYAQRW